MVDAKEGGFLFIDAPGGTGKTYLANMALANIRSREMIALAVASSGIAAQLLPNGRTAHSTFKIPLNLMTTEKPTCNIKRGSATAALLANCTAVFWDEATMINKTALDAVDRTMRDIRKSDRLFGGILFILSGDFRQTLPIIRCGTRANEIRACIKSSHLWDHVETYSLRKNMRVHLFNDTNAAKFSDVLLQLGEGRIPYDELDTHKITIPHDLATTLTTLDQLIAKVYDKLHEKFDDTQWLMERAILAPLNQSVYEINNVLLYKFPGDIKIYRSIDSVKDEGSAVAYPTEFLNSLNPAGIPLHRLALKVGIPVMVIRNLAPGIANGTRLIIKRMLTKCFETVIATGPRKGQIFIVPMISLTPNDTGLPFEFTRRQFPVKLCLSITINKSQGQTLKAVGLHLEEPCFSHGQFYVGCSRVSTNNNLYISTANNSTKNVVYKEVLS